MDIACGSGYGSAALSAVGAVLGVDASPDAVAFAKARYSAENISFEVGDGEDLNQLASDSFDVVVSFETIEHLHHPTRFLAELSRVLRPGGLLLLSTPNRRLASSKYPLTGKPNNPFHVFEYTGRSLQQDLSSWFRVEAFLGQVYVPTLLAAWPVQVAFKSVCHLLRPLGAYTLVRGIYHNRGDVQVSPPRQGRQPSIFVVACRSLKPRKELGG